MLPEDPAGVDLAMMRVNSRSIILADRGHRGRAMMVATVRLLDGDIMLAVAVREGQGPMQYPAVLAALEYIAILAE